MSTVLSADFLKVDPSAVRMAAPGEDEQVIGTLVLAFAADPPVRWLFPESRQYLACFPRFARAFGGAAFEHESACHVGDFAGAALWLPPGAHPDEEALGDIVEAELAPDKKPHMYAILEALGSHHPIEPHWHLPLIGVEPTTQGRGYGSALLTHMLRRIDESRLPVYLESTNPANIPLYQRHGFELRGTVQSGDSPPMFPMIRAAR